MSGSDKKNGASIIDRILDRLGYRDGAWRRAFVSGLIFLALVASYQVPPFDKLAGSAQRVGTIKELLKSTQALMVVTLLIFASGFVVDGVSRGFLVRGVSVTAWWIDKLARQVGKAGTRSRRWWSWLVNLFTFPLWPLLILVNTVRSTGQTVKLYRFGLRPSKARTKRDQLTQRGRKWFNGLPEAVRKGLDEPYGDKFDAAWQGLTVIAPADQRQWINRLAARNYDLTSFVAAAFAGLLVGLPAHLLHQIGTHWSLGFGYAIFSYLMMCLASYLLFGCFAIVRRAAVSVIEVLAIPQSAEAKPGGDPL